MNQKDFNSVDMKGMIFAAGLGTRMKPLTDKIPKALIPVNGKTLLQRNIEYLAGYQVKDIIINVHHFAEQVTEVLQKKEGFGSMITLSDERNLLLDTGGGLKNAAWYFTNEKKPFVVINVDILTNLRLDTMIVAHKKSGSLATLAVTSRITSRYFLFDESGRLCGWQNSKTGERRIVRKSSGYTSAAFSGIHVISPELFPLIKMEGRFSIVELYLELAKDYPIYAFDHTGGKFIDVGRPENIKEAEMLFPS
jgi:N-acetyl-alpha-D-muramate 1-phosphate uridylyltransferase